MTDSVHSAQAFADALKQRVGERVLEWVKPWRDKWQGMTERQLRLAFIDATVWRHGCPNRNRAAQQYLRAKEQQLDTGDPIVRKMLDDSECKIGLLNTLLRMAEEPGEIDRLSIAGLYYAIERTSTPDGIWLTSWFGYQKQTAKVVASVHRHTGYDPFDRRFYEAACPAFGASPASIDFAIVQLFKTEPEAWKETIAQAPAGTKRVEKVSFQPKVQVSRARREPTRIPIPTPRFRPGY